MACGLITPCAALFADLRKKQDDNLTLFSLRLLLMALLPVLNGQVPGLLMGSRQPNSTWSTPTGHSNLSSNSSSLHV